MGSRRALAFAALLATGISGSTYAIPELYDQLCASCHQDDSPTCAGCHNHRGEISASPDRSSYAPGEAVRVTLEGGLKPGWIRGILYDHEGTEIARATGPSGTGDDGVPADSVAFPVVLSSTAPLEFGEYVWRAAYYGVYQFTEMAHGEDWVSLTIHVVDPDSVVQSSWGRLKERYREEDGLH